LIIGVFKIVLALPGQASRLNGNKCTRPAARSHKYLQSPPVQASRLNLNKLIIK